jgi:hypothetical protein
LGLLVSTRTLFKAELAIIAILPLAAIVVLQLSTTNLLPQAQAQIADHVVINEVELNPAGDDAGKEWVELYNPTPIMIDLTGWTLQTTHGETVTVTIPQGAQISPNGYYVVTNAAQWLDNQNESIILRDKNGQQKDLTPALSDTANDDYTSQRYPEGSDN